MTLDDNRCDEAAFGRCSPRGGQGVLVIEDEHHIRALIGLLLEQKGYRLFEAADTEEAARVWSEQRSSIDLVLCDILLPNQTGPELIRELRKEDPDLKVVFMSGIFPRDSSDFASGHGQFAFVKKPFTSRHLVEAVERALDHVPGKSS